MVALGNSDQHKTNSNKSAAKVIKYFYKTKFTIFPCTTITFLIAFPSIHF